jgi:hypothetical protein
MSCLLFLYFTGPMALAMPGVHQRTTGLSSLKPVVLWRHPATHNPLPACPASRLTWEHKPEPKILEAGARPAPAAESRPAVPGRMAPGTPANHPARVLFLRTLRIGTTLGRIVPLPNHTPFPYIARHLLNLTRTDITWKTSHRAGTAYSSTTIIGSLRTQLISAGIDPPVAATGRLFSLGLGGQADLQAMGLPNFFQIPGQILHMF